MANETVNQHVFRGDQLKVVCNYDYPTLLNFLQDAMPTFEARKEFSDFWMLRGLARPTESYELVLPTRERVNRWHQSIIQLHHGQVTLDLTICYENPDVPCLVGGFVMSGSYRDGVWWWEMSTHP